MAMQEWIGKLMKGKRGEKSSMPPGYTIPIVDLGADSDRRVIIDREPGQYLGHPTTVRLLCFCRRTLESNTRLLY